MKISRKIKLFAIQQAETKGVVINVTEHLANTAGQINTLDLNKSLDSAVVCLKNDFKHQVTPAAVVPLPAIVMVLSLVGWNEQEQSFGGLPLDPNKPTIFITPLKFFDSSDWHPIRISSSVKKHTVGTGKDKSGRYHYRDLGTGKFSKSAMDKAKDSFCKGELPSSSIDSSIKGKLFDYRGCRELRFVRVESDGIETGGLALVCNDSYGDYSVTKGNVNIQGSLGFDGRINLASGRSESSFGENRVDVDAVNVSVKAGCQIVADNEQIDIGLKGEVIFRGPTVTAESKSRKICMSDNCYTLKVTPYSGIGRGGQIGIGYHHNKKTTNSTLIFSGGAGYTRMLGAHIAIEKEQKDPDSYHKTNKPSSL